MSERILKEDWSSPTTASWSRGTTSTPTTTGIWRWLTVGRRPQLPQRDGEDTLHHRPVQGEERVLEMEIPQLQEIAGKVWKKEDELKQLKSELAALDRKIQLELAPPTPEVAEKENEGQQLKPEAEDVRNRQAQYPENAPPQIRSPADSIVANHVIIGRPGLYAKEETRSKGLKI
ncbi:hypothetical protein [Bacteroides fragilis]|uniref:hypothetical protein n=1 Tax=Bacteroides fragilis TaxID=817 RepID=UPI00374EBAF1